MKTTAFAVIWGVVLSGGLAANPIYQIAFTGTITSGQAMDFEPATNATGTAADLTGLKVSGWIRFDLGAAPAPVTSTDANGFINTLLQGSGGPIFMSEHFAIDGLTIPADFLPLATTFDLIPIPPLPSGTTITQNSDVQTLSISTRPNGAAQAVLPFMNLGYSWSNPQVSASDTISLGLLISGIQQFFPIPPSGQLPSSWGPVTTGVNGVFSFAELSQDQTQLDPAHHFGVTTDYNVKGLFALDSASGGFVTPEPGTLATSAAFLLLAVARTRSRVKGRP